MKGKYYIVLFSQIVLLIFSSCTLKQVYKDSNIIEKDSIINGFHFVFIPKGKYTFGIRKIIKRIDYNYWIMKFEVTNLEYYNFLKTALNNNNLFLSNDTVKIYYRGDNIRKKGIYTVKILDNRIFLKDSVLHLDTAFANHPVTEVTWFGATAFCEHYGLKLPDIFEWEKAARGMTGYNYPWGDTLDSHKANYHNSGDPFDNNTTPVGYFDGQNHNGYQTTDSKSPYGCYDMAGNAWENLEAPITKSHPLFLYGGGGGYLYHTGAMCQTWYHKLAGIRDNTARIDRPFKTDGFRCVLKK